MNAFLDNIDPTGLEEFSVVFTDRSLNHMSSSFQQVMNDISAMLKEVYSSDAVVIVPEVELSVWRQSLDSLAAMQKF